MLACNFVMHYWMLTYHYVNECSESKRVKNKSERLERSKISCSKDMNKAIIGIDCKYSTKRLV